MMVGVMRTSRPHRLALSLACALGLVACKSDPLSPAVCPVGSVTGADGLCKSTCDDVDKPCLLTEACVEGRCEQRDPELPTVVLLRATPETVAVGGEADVEFVVTGADKAELLRFEGAGADQSVFVDDTDPRAGRIRLARIVQDTYVRLEASRGGGARMDTKEIVIRVAGAGDVSIERFDASRTMVRAGDRVLFTWQTNNADAVHIKRDGTIVAGNLPARGTKELVVDRTAVYGLLAEGSPADAYQELEVKVVDAPGPEVLEGGFNPSRASIREGDNAVLKWRTAGASQVQLQAEGNVLYTTSDQRTMEDGRFLLSPGPGTRSWEVVAQAPPQTPTSGAATQQVVARPEVPVFGQQPSVTPQVFPAFGNEEAVEVLVQWRVQPVDAQVQVTVAGMSVDRTGAAEHHVRLPTNEPARIEVRATVPGGGVASHELIVLPQSPEEENNDTPLTANTLQDRARTGQLTRGQVTWDTDWYTLEVEADERLVATLAGGASGPLQCPPGLELAVRRSGLGQDLASAATGPNGACPTLVLERLMADTYRVRVSVSPQANMSTVYDYVVAGVTFGPKCGDGVVDAGEVCDDGARAAGDACSPDCAIPATHQYSVEERSVALGEPPSDAHDVHFLPYSAAPAEDDGYAVLELPTPFPYFGRTFHGLLLTTNGYLSFLPTAGGASSLNDPLGPAAPNALVTAYGSDLVMTPSSRVVWWVEDDAAAKQRFIIELKDMALAADERARIHVRVELVADGALVIGYGDLDVPADQAFVAGLEGPQGIVQVNLPRCDSTCTPGDLRGRSYTFVPVDASRDGGG